MIKLLFGILLFVFVFNTTIFAEYLEKKIPKPEIHEFNTLKSSDLTNKIQVNASLGGNIWLWDNFNDSKLTFNIQSISLGVDRYFLFYNGATANLFYNFETSTASLSMGYKLRLYEFFYSKIEIESAVYPYLDLGTSVSLGIEFSLFNLLRVFSYTDFTTFLLNSKNLTTIYFNYYLGLGGYF